LKTVSRGVLVVSRSQITEPSYRETTYRRPQGDLRATNRQDSIDAPAMAETSVRDITGRSRLDAWAAHGLVEEDDEDAWAADLEEELFS
jgi:hypothetical protein